MATGYEDIDKLTSQKQSMLNESLKQQNEIVNKQTQMNVDKLERQKQDIQKDAVQTNRALYKDYKKTSNPFGAQAENLASQGLGNAGYAETTQANLYNTYQQNITNTLNNARDLKANVDFQISQAKQTGNITLAQNALEIYKQRMLLLTEEYDLRNNKEQFLYQQQRDKVADTQWERQYNRSNFVQDRNYKYQKERDKVTDNRWEREYNRNNFIQDRNYNYQKNRDKVADTQWLTQYNRNKLIQDRDYKYQKYRDEVSDKRYSKEFDYNKGIDERNYKYQKYRDEKSDKQWDKEYKLKKNTSDRDYKYQKYRNEVADKQWDKTYKYNKYRDEVSDKQWEKEYQLSKKGIASSSRRSSSSRKKTSKKTSSSSTTSINIDDDVKTNVTLSVPTKNSGTEYTPQEIMSNVKTIQGVGITNPIQDGISGKTFKSIDALLNYYGYAGVND